MKIQGIMATTHIDRHNMKFTKEALESGAAQINGPRKPKVGVEHDNTVPPLGKILEGWVEPTEDGEFRLVKVAELFEGFKATTLSEGTTLLKQECETDRSPFLLNDELQSDQFVLAYDRINFGSEEKLNAFVQEIKSTTDTTFEEAEFFRKSVIPDPEIIIRLSKLLVQYLIAKNILDKAGDKIIELGLQEITKFYSFVRSSVITALKYAIPKNRPITYIFELPGRPFIEFVARSNDSNAVLSALIEENLIEALSRAKELNALFHAEKIQFLLNEKGEWEFNYLLTDTGAVIGTERSFARRERRVQLMLSSMEKDSSDTETDAT
jgi:hypothetical protein